MTDVLIPCPFCGSEKAAVRKGFDYFTVSCKNCAAEGPLDEERSNAVTFWNRRGAPHVIHLPVIDPSLMEVGK